MQSILSPCDKSLIPLGQRRGIADLARFSLDLTWTSHRVESEAARSGAYPSPPMSVSPSSPPKPSQDVGDLGQAQGNHRPTSQQQGAYQPTMPQQQTAAQLRHLPLPPSLGGRPFMSAQSEPPRVIYPQYQASGDGSVATATTPYHHPPGSLIMGPPPYGGLPPPVPRGPPYPVPSLPRFHQTESMPVRSQRKAKGHVASACLPCKKAHLRCDAQRPCMRCVTNQKEGACIDVPPKKRGRPRIRENNYDNSRSGVHQEAGRGPPEVYSAVGGDPRHPSYTDPDAYQPPLSIAARPPEPLAYLTLQFEVAKASQTFVEGLGNQGADIAGRQLAELVIPEEREKVRRLQSELQEEKSRTEQSYLPRILPKDEENKALATLGFGLEALAAVSLSRLEYLTFQLHAEEQPRTVAVHLGLGKKEPVWFVALALSRGTGPYPSPGHQPRELSTPYYPRLIPPALQRPQGGFTQRTPVSATFETGPRQPRPPTQMTTLSPGFSPGAPSYSALPSRPDYPPSYQTPRSELVQATNRPLSHPPSVQLPPIRAPPHMVQGPPSASSDSGWPRDERQSRVDIGELLEWPDRHR